MTRVCLIGDPECTLQYELLSRETSREALATYELSRPFENSLALRTVSVGAAVSLLNDLQWYLTRFVDEAFVQEPSVSEDEWLSRSLAEALRNGTIEPEDTGEYCKIYGLERDAPSPAVAPDGADGMDGVDAASSEDAAVDADADTDTGTEDASAPATQSQQAETTVADAVRPRLVEPLYVRRTDGELPEYDLRDVEETLVVRLTEDEYSP